jgi:hypothetical protein
MASTLLPLDTSAGAIRTTTLTVPHRPASPATPLSPSSGDVRDVLSHIQFVAHKSATLAHAIAQREAQLDRAADGDNDDAPPRALTRAFSAFPEAPATPPATELDAIKAALEDIWHATVPLTGAAHSLNHASLLLRNRLYGIVRDVARYLDVVAGELQAWLGDGEHGPLTPVSMEGEGGDKGLDAIMEEDGSHNTTAAATTPAERIPAAHVAAVLDVMLALLEASSGMLAAMSRSRASRGGLGGGAGGIPGIVSSSGGLGLGAHAPAHSRNVSTSSTSSTFSSADDCKEAASRSLDRARFQTHMYRPENEGLSAAYADADRLGFRALEAHVAGLTSYLWCDFGGQ